jgi:hypothetical protein
MKHLALLAAVSCVSTSAVGQIWNEVGDAGDVPATAQLCLGSGPLSVINGSWMSQADVDMYLIHIADAQAFRATTIGLTGNDTQLFLFFTNGMGVTFDDDSKGDLQSTLTNQFIPAAGDYYIAVSNYDVDAADSGGLEIWNDTPFEEERQPDGPGANNPIHHWVGGSSEVPDTYGITLFGCEYVVPEPSSFVALAGAAFFLLHRRRR